MQQQQHIDFFETIFSKQAGRTGKNISIYIYFATFDQAKEDGFYSNN